VGDSDFFAIKLKGWWKFQDHCFFPVFREKPFAFGEREWAWVLELGGCFGF